jgi:lysylphosphatidylglycerol synthetase-like protein (DUF2156 family)
VPGVGNAVGAGVGAVVGGAGGAVGGAKAKKAYKMATRTNGRVRRLIVMEFAICIVIVALSPLTDAKKDEPPPAVMKRFSAVVALFFVLGMVASMGRGAANAAAGLGGVVTVALLVSRRDLLAKLADIFAAPSSGTGRTTGPMTPVVD